MGGEGGGTNPTSLSTNEPSSNSLSHNSNDLDSSSDPSPTGPTASDSRWARPLSPPPIYNHPSRSRTPSKSPTRPQTSRFSEGSATTPPPVYDLSVEIASHNTLCDCRTELHQAHCRLGRFDADGELQRHYPRTGQRPRINVGRALCIIIPVVALLVVGIFFIVLRVQRVNNGVGT